MDVEIGIRNDWKYFNMDWAMDRAETLAQVIWHCFSWLAKQPGINLPEAGSMSPMSKCSCICLCYGCFLILGFSTSGFQENIGNRWSFTADHMKIRCPEEDVNLTHGYGYVVKRAGINSICLMHTSSKRYPDIKFQLKTDHYFTQRSTCHNHKHSMLSIPIGTIWRQQV